MGGQEGFTVGAEKGQCLSHRAGLEAFDSTLWNY
jgi:hypothetical protein